ncbi:hypothetical protein [Tengunoibacter tsumagoiensis]|uniref:Uncharacterized protein n=1 Tax=Tengunoibacter tsumagoiensis TaxID=2014871 RepID=A0A401ZXB5_9CHLR|nr:hypothetical protein [Tengunoibacter tsumagoiensis]GCE11482.1 hypothetical protein KTT_13410 [Tengunoibacter tsumagoiensis]
MKLRNHLKEGVRATFPDWKYEPGDDTGFRIDIWNIDGLVPDLEILHIEQEPGFTKVMVRLLRKDVQCRSDISIIVGHMMSLIQESFLLLIDMSSKTTFQYWFLTGGGTHGHEGVFIFDEVDMPHFD